MSDGEEYRVRPIRADDAERERRFIVALRPESRFRRLMYTLREPSAQFIAQLVNVDHHRNMALVAVQGREVDERFIAVARYAADASGEDCEFAVAVADEWQCRGIGTLLTRLLFEYAAHEGFRSIYGNILASNHDMLELAGSLDLQVEMPLAGENTVRASRRLN